MAALLPMILQYGIPAGIEGFHFVQEMIDSWKNNKNMTQAEFEAKWIATRKRYQDAGHAWDEAGKSPDAKA